MTPAWYVLYDAETKRLGREGPHEHAAEGGYEQKSYDTDPGVIDQFTGRRLKRWEPSLADYIPVSEAP